MSKASCWCQNTHTGSSGGTGSTQDAQVRMLRGGGEGLSSIHAVHLRGLLCGGYHRSHGKTAEDYDRHRPNRRKTKRRAAGRASLPSFRRRGSEIRSFWKIHKETKVPGPTQNGWMNPGHPPLETPGLGSRWPPTRGAAHIKERDCGRRPNLAAQEFLSARKNYTSSLGALGVQSLASHPGLGCGELRSAPSEPDDRDRVTG